ncbi:hypothetical protein ACLKA6_002619 [Drosophila palustris]
MGKLARRPMPTDLEQLLDIVTTLFPEHPAANLVADIQQTAPKYTEITEILEAAANIKVNKAPGPDGVPSKVQRRSYHQKRCDNGEMAGEMESYCKRQLDETYRPGHTAVGRHDSISETSSESVHAGNLAHLYAPCASSAQLGSLVPIQEHPAGQRMRSLSSPPLLLRDCLNSRTPSCSAQVSLVSAAEQLNFPDAAQMHHYLAAEPSEAGGRCTVRSSEEIAAPAK